MSSYLSQKDSAELTQLIEQFEHFKTLLEECDYTHSEAEYFEIMSNLWSFRSAFDNEKVAEAFCHTEFFQEHKSFFLSHEQYYTRALESAKSISIMTKMASSTNIGIFDLINGDYMQQSYNHVNEELKLIDTKKCKRLVMVGCGPYPETILYLNENIEHTEIIGLDESREAIYMSGKMLESQNLEKIELQSLAGYQFDFTEVDVVHIANFVPSKKKILDRIVETAPDHVQILVRTPQLLGSIFYTDPLTNLNSRLIIVNETITNQFFSYKTILLQKFVS
ncbi:MAG: hypothetical protein ACI9QC_000667 [Oceanicoccus sp.]|jgi:hypothetical protein